MMRIQTFGYDRYGNRTQFSQTVMGNVFPTNAITKPTIDPANNRFTTGQGYVYDLNGNLIQDAEGRQFIFNGDDKQTVVRDVYNAVVGEYYYDGSGARVKKVVPSTGETTIFVYDAGGALAAEYSTQAPPANPTTNYLTTDHLGSPRVITDAQGQVTARRDFMPFGEELGVGVGGRTESLKYSATGPDRVRKRFTGYEKDSETGLDFAEARMYQNKHGRFTAVDPLLASATATNPQTFNRYTYTGNDPINLTDPNGLNWCRKRDGTTTFVGENVKCAKVDGEDVTNSVAEITAGDWSKEKAKVGDTVILNANGSVTVVNSPEARAIAQGQSVVEASVEVSGQTATGAAAEILATGGSTVSGTIVPRGLLPLPCPPSMSGCGSGNVSPPPSIVQGASAADVQVLLDVVGMTEIPLVSQAADITSAVISLIQGDTVGGALGVGAALPVVGSAFSGTKWARRAADTAGDVGKAVHGNSKASTVAQHGYEAFETATGNIVKTGVSSGPVTKSGKSYRANRQIREWNKSNPGAYDARIVKTQPPGSRARDKILKWENAHAEKLRATGHLRDRSRHKRP